MSDEIKMAAPEEVRSPAIRTMKSDLEDLFKNTKPSLIQMIGRTQERLPVATGRPGKIRLILPLSLLALLAVAGTAVFFYLGGDLKPPADGMDSRTRERLTPAAPYFATETSRTITVKKQDRSQFLRLMQDSYKETEREGTVKRIIMVLEDGPLERYATPADFFELWRIAAPGGLAERLDDNLMAFIYYGASGGRLGLAARTREPERAFANMLSWEPGLLTSITPLFFDERSDAVIAPFEDRTYRNIDWRYLKLSQERDLGIGYTVFPVGNIFILTTSKEAMETVINRLFDAR